MRLTDWGATLIAVELPRDGRPPLDVVLGATDLESLRAGFPAGATIGRVANRIAYARFTLDGEEIELDANEGLHHLHGGRVGFARRRWSVEPVGAGSAEQAIRFRHRSPEGEDRYPGTLDVSVTFTLTDRDELRIEYRAETDRATPVNLTNHAYFNLAGAGDVLGQELWMDADGFTPVDDEKIPTGEIAPVTGTPLDFRTPHQIGERIAALEPGTGGYDHNLVLRENRDALEPCIRLRDPGSGRTLEMLTTEPGVQLYTGNHFERVRGRGGVEFPRHGGVCLETQHFPDAVNQPAFPSVILRPGTPFASATTLRFRFRGAA